ncbi:hypothetical protein LCER1_G003662 [Lachnellula cervina]|uniref:Uncharacterized protein n=1 Tax=Lachnellula cervina TaxID=1316786 RepID=A0A7D8YM01_9HELO|nr:hypothetical protein LCER1_G003662 [Lachnellula cervina]
MDGPRKIGQLPLHLQLQHFRKALSTNPTLLTILRLAPQLKLTHWYLAAGSVTQTVWNYVSGLDPGTGISDYDLVYYDASDLSWEAEDRVIQASKKLFAGIAVEVEVRNQARAHLWYGEKYGVECVPYKTLEDGIDRFISNTAIIGVRIREDAKGQQEDEWDIYAPWGLSAMFNLVVRPNPVLGNRETYEKKSERWKAIWNGLTIEPWPKD